MQEIINMKHIINELKVGNFVIVIDDKNREDESDLVIAGEFITPEKIAFILDNCSGIICVSMTMEKIKKIGIPLLERINFDYATAPFCVSVDAKGTHTGVSAYDRCLTIKKLCDDSATINDFKVPGHVFPLYAHPNGLKARKGHTEAAVELMKLAGLKEVAVICELMNTSANCNDNQNNNNNCDKNNNNSKKNNNDKKNNDNQKKIGTMMRDEDITFFSEKYSIPVISINYLLN